MYDLVKWQVVMTGGVQPDYDKITFQREKVNTEASAQWK
jgi:hypothetical protein